MNLGGHSQLSTFSSWGKVDKDWGRGHMDINKKKLVVDETGWPNEWRARPSPVLGDRGIQTSWVRTLFESNQ